MAILRVIRAQSYSLVYPSVQSTIGCDSQWVKCTWAILQHEIFIIISLELLLILIIQIRYNDGVKNVDVEDVNPPVILSQLPTDTVYNIRVSATNSAGEGSYSNTITTNTLSKGMLIV